VNFGLCSTVIQIRTKRKFEFKGGKFETLATKCYSVACQMLVKILFMTYLIVSCNLSNMKDFSNNGCFIVFHFEVLSEPLKRLKRML